MNIYVKKAGNKTCFLYNMYMMKQKTACKNKEMYIRVTNIHWNEGPKYKGPKSFWFVVNEQTYKNVKSDPINKMALFQMIDNELDDACEYAGVNSELLEFEFVRPEQLKQEEHYAKWGLHKGDTVSVTDLTDITY